METELRRNEISLVTLGTGVLLFGVWSVVKILLYLRTEAFASLENSVSHEELLFVKILSFVILALLLLIDFGIRLKIGRAARAEGMGCRQKNTYLYLTVLLMLVNLFLDGFGIFFAVTVGLGGHSYVDFAVSLLVDLSVTVLLAELIITVRRVRKLRALLEG